MWFLFLLVGQLPSVLSAQEYKSLNTSDFQYHYPVELRTHAEEVAHITEEVAQTLMDKYQIDLPKPVQVRISNALYSNGQANSVMNQMRLWVTDWDIRLRTTHPWIEDVTTHEFSHLVTIGLTPKLPPFIYGAQAIYQGYYNDPAQARLQWMLPFRFHTAWLAEGISQYESSLFGFDHWDTHRDMIMREAVLNKQVLSLSKMDHFDSDQEIELETGPYTQGFNLVRFIAQEYGDSALVQIWQNHARWDTWSFDQCVEDVLGISSDSLHSQWMQHLEAHYQAQVTQLGSFHMGQKLSYGSFNNHQIQSHQDSIFWLSNLSSGSWREQIVSSHDSTFPAYPNDTLLDPSQDSLAWSQRKDLKPQVQLDKAWLSRGWTRDSLGRYYYASYAHRDTLDRARLDIHLQDSTQTYPLTYEEDAFFPVLSPRQGLYYVRRPTQGTQFELVQSAQISDSLLAQIAELSGELDLRKVRRFYSKLQSQQKVLFNQDIYQSQTGVQARQFNIYSFDINSQDQIILSFYDGYNRQLALLSPGVQQFQLLKVEATDLRDPVWSSDSQVVFSWNLNGVFNLYEFNVNSTQLQARTHVRGGAFQPRVHRDQLYYSNYDRDGFSLYRLSRSDTLDPSLSQRLPSILKLKKPAQDLGQEQRQFEGSERDYNPFELKWIVSPIALLEQRANNGAQVSSSRELAFKLGASLQWMDPLMWHSFQLSFLTEVDQGIPGLDPEVQSDLFLRYDNHMMPIPVFAEGSHRAIQVQSQYYSEDGVLQGSEAGISLSQARLGFGKSIFKNRDSLAVFTSIGGGRQEIPRIPSWWFVRSASLGFEYGNSGHISNGPQMTPGFQYKISSEYQMTELQDSVYLESQFSMGVDYEDWETQLTEIQGLWVTSIPYVPEAMEDWVIGLKGSLGHVERISNTAYVDTTDSWLQPVLWIDGYPFLEDVSQDGVSQGVLFRGDNKILWEAHLQHPLWESELSWRGFHHRGAWLSWIAQAGQAWDGSLFNRSIWREFNYSRSLGVEFRMSQKVFHSMPLEMYFKLSRALDEVEGVGDLNQRFSGASFLPSSLRPTAIYYGLTFSFSNPVIYRNQEAGH